MSIARQKENREVTWESVRFTVHLINIDSSSVRGLGVRVRQQLILGGVRYRGERTYRTPSTMFVLKYWPLNPPGKLLEPIEHS